MISAFNHDNYIVVNYHYIENPVGGFPAVFPCSVANFEKQIMFLVKEYNMVSVGGVFEAAKKGHQGKFCALAFDDGLKDQFDIAVPILKKHRVFGIFFPITSVWEGKMPAAHKIHILLSKFSAEKIALMFADFLKVFYPKEVGVYDIPKNKRLTAKRLHEPPLIANFKEVFIVLPLDIKYSFLDFCFNSFNLNENSLINRMFMSKKQVAFLEKMGMEIGAHSHSHNALDTLSLEFLRQDIETAVKTLSEVLNHRPIVFSYPHGRTNKRTIDILQEYGFKYGLTIEERSISSKDDRFLIPRYDTNSLKRLSLDEKFADRKSFSKTP